MPAKKKMSDKVDKRLRQKITIGTGADGRPIIKYASGRSKRELAANAEELRRTYIGGQEVDRTVLFGAYVLAWYHAYKEPKLSEGSKQAYMSILRAHLLPELEHRQLRAITAADLQLLLNSKAGMSVSALGYMHSILTNVFRKAAAAGIIDRDPTLGLTKPTAQKQRRRAMTDAEKSAALKVGQEHPEGLLLLLLYYTGMRLGEVLGLQWQDIDFAKRVITVRRDLDYKMGETGPLKSRAAYRQVPIPDELCAPLQAIRGVGHGFVLSAPTTASWLPQATYKRRWERLMIAIYETDSSIERAVIRIHKGKMGKDGKRGKDIPVYGSALTAHYFRHNYASVLYNAGVDILAAQRFMGHSDPSITMGIYSHLAKDKEDTAGEIVRNAIAGKVAKRLPE